MPRVIVIGGANVDIKGKSSARAILGTSNPGTVTTSVGGVGRNIAHNLALLGVDVALIAMIGSDANGGLIERYSRDAGIDTSLLRRAEGASGTYLAMLDCEGELISAINAMDCANAMTTGMLDRARPRLEQADFLVADCNIPVACLAWACGFARDSGKRLLIEPVSVPKSQKLRQVKGGLHAFVITPNRDQAQALGETDGLGVQNVVMHAGADGAHVTCGKSEPVHVPAFATGHVRDVTGAGDAAVAGLVWGLVSGYDVIAAARFGQAAAALKLTSAKSIAESVSREALLELVGTAQ